MTRGPRDVRWLVVLAAALPAVLAAFSTTQLGLYFAEVGAPRPWLPLFLYNLSLWYVWAALVPVVVRLARRFPVERARPGRLALHLGLALLVSLAHLIVHTTVQSWTPGAKWLPTLRLSFAAYYHWNLLVYGLVWSAVQAADFQRRYREGHLRASQLEGELARAQLDALRLQLQPHFLFNTLQSIAELVHEDPEAAERMVVRLSDLLRAALQDGGSATVPLRRELALLERYLDIQQVRFQGRLKVTVDAQPEALECRVPTLVLQPLVENAVRHGIGRLAGGSVDVRVRHDDGTLEIVVADDGPGVQPPIAEGLGLANTRSRLERLYGARHTFEVGGGDGRGFTVRMAIPAERTDSPGQGQHPA